MRIVLIEKVTRREPTETELAWAAGFWDGEGSVVASVKRPHPVLGLTQAGDEGRVLCVRFLVSLGIEGRVYDFKDARPSRWKPYHRALASGEEVVLALDRVRPFLSFTKIAQAERHISAWRLSQEKPHWMVVRTHCKNNHEFTSENIRMRGTTRICLECRRAAGRRAYENSKN